MTDCTCSGPEPNTGHHEPTCLTMQPPAYSAQPDREWATRFLDEWKSPHFGREIHDAVGLVLGAAHIANRPACTCDRNPETTDGPEEDCPIDGRPYAYWVERSDSQGAEVLRLREGIKDLAANTPLLLVEVHKRIEAILSPPEVTPAEVD